MRWATLLFKSAILVQFCAWGWHSSWASIDTSVFIWSTNLCRPSIRNVVQPVLASPSSRTVGQPIFARPELWAHLKTRLRTFFFFVSVLFPDLWQSAHLDGSIGLMELSPKYQSLMLGSSSYNISRAAATQPKQINTSGTCLCQKIKWSFSSLQILGISTRAPSQDGKDHNCLMPPDCF